MLLAATGEVKPIEVRLMEYPVHDGDWHDKPSRYEVLGPGNERQVFSTKKGALKWRSIRRKCLTLTEAHRMWSDLPLDTPY